MVRRAQSPRERPQPRLQLVPAHQVVARQVTSPLAPPPPPPPLHVGGGRAPAVRTPPRAAGAPSAPCASTRSDRGRAEAFCVLALSATDEQRAVPAPPATSSGGSRCAPAAPPAVSHAAVGAVPPGRAPLVPPSCHDAAGARHAEPAAPPSVPRASTRAISSLGLAPAVADAYAAQGVTHLYPWQANVFAAYAGRACNVLIVAPTSGGKTLPALLLMLRRFEDEARAAAAAAAAGAALACASAQEQGSPPPGEPARRPLALIVVPYVTLAREYEARLRLLTAPARRVDCAAALAPAVGAPLGVEALYEQRGSLPLGADVSIVVCTIERAVGLLRALEREGRLPDLICAILDEIHIATDPSRGGKFELLATKLVYTHVLSAGRLQLIAMSATLPDVPRFARWLRAEVFEDRARPQPLPVCVALFAPPAHTPNPHVPAAVRGGGCSAGAGANTAGVDLASLRVLPIERVGGDADGRESGVGSGVAPAAKRARAAPAGAQRCTSRYDAAAMAQRLSAIVSLAAQLREQQSATARLALLIFCATKQRARDVARALCAARSARGGARGDEGERAAARVARCIEDAAEADPSGTLRIRADMEAMLLWGVAYHTAELTHAERTLVEDLFRCGAIDTICSTSTLAAGVNLPVDCVLVDGLFSGDSRLTAAVYRQMIGRAGRGPARAGVDASAHAGRLPSVGAYLVVASVADARAARELHSSEIRDPGSALGEQADLIVLNGVVSGLASTADEAAAFFACSLCAQHAARAPAAEARAAIDRMASVRLIEVGLGGSLRALPRGEACVALHEPIDAALALETELVELLRGGLSLASLVHPIFVLAAPGDANTDAAGWRRLCAVLADADGSDPELYRMMASVGLHAAKLDAHKPPSGAERWAHRQRRFVEALALNALIAARPQQQQQQPQPQQQLQRSVSAQAASDAALAALHADQLAALKRRAARRAGRACAFLEAMQWPREYALAAKLREMLAALCAEEDQSACAELRSIPGVGATDAQLLVAAGLTTVELVAADQRAEARAGARARGARRGGAVLAAISKPHKWRMAAAAGAPASRSRACDRSAAALHRAALDMVRNARALVAAQLAERKRRAKAGRRVLAAIDEPRAAQLHELTSPPQPLHHLRAAARARKRAAPPSSAGQENAWRTLRPLAPHMCNDAISIGGTDERSGASPAVDPIRRIELHAPLGALEPPADSARRASPSSSAPTSMRHLLAAMARATHVGLCVHAERAGARGARAREQDVLGVALAIAPASVAYEVPLAPPGRAQPAPTPERAAAGAGSSADCEGRATDDVPALFYLPLDVCGADDALRALLETLASCDVSAFAARDQLALLAGRAAAFDAVNAASEVCAEPVCRAPPRLALRVHDPAVLALLERGHDGAVGTAAQLAHLAREFGLGAQSHGAQRVLSAVGAACLQARLTLALTNVLRERLAARAPRAAPVPGDERADAALGDAAHLSADFVEAALPALLCRADCEGICIETSAIGRVYGELWRTRGALEAEAARQAGRRVNLACKAEVTTALAQVRGTVEEKANVAMLKRLAASGSILAALALEHRHITDLMRHHVALRRHVVPGRGESAGVAVAFPRTRQASCVSGRLHYADGGFNPQLLPKAPFVVRMAALAASARSLHDRAAVGLLPVAAQQGAGAGVVDVLVLDGTFGRKDDGGDGVGSCVAHADADDVAARVLTQPDEHAARAPRARRGARNPPLPRGAHVARLELNAPVLTMAECRVLLPPAAAADGRAGCEARERSLAEVWGYSPERAAEVHVAFVTFDGRPPAGSPALAANRAADDTETVDGGGTMEGEARAPARADEADAIALADAGGTQPQHGARAPAVPWPADKVHALSLYACAEATDWAVSGDAGARAPDGAPPGAFERTHPPRGALVVRPSARVRVCLRECVRARPGCVLVTADYRNAELTIAAHFALDRKLAHALSGERDPFETIALLLRKPPSDSRVHREERDAAKGACYCVLYGGGSRDAEARVFDAFPAVSALIARLQRSCAQPGAAVRTLCGRRRVFTEQERRDSGLLRRRALNALCQGSVADLIKLAMLANDDLEERLTAATGAPARARLLMHVHDELIYEVGPVELLERRGACIAAERDLLGLAVTGIVDGMTGAGARAALSLPLRVSVKVGATWGGAAPYTLPRATSEVTVGGACQ